MVHHCNLCVVDTVGGAVWVVAVDTGYGGGSDVGRSSGDHAMASSQRRHQENCLDCDNTHLPLSHFACCWLQGTWHDKF